MIARLAFTAIFFVGFEALLFHTSIYPSLLAPESTTGKMEIRLRDEQRRAKKDHNQILGIGDSRMALVPRIANETSSETGYTYASISLGGIMPRCWYYALRTADPTAHAYTAIVMSTNDYNEPDNPEDVRDRESDLHYLGARLTLRDLPVFPWTYHDTGLQWIVVRDMLLKGLLYKRDFQVFLVNPVARIHDIREWDKNSVEWLNNFAAPEQSLDGLEIDWRHRTARFPDRFTPELRQNIIDSLLHAPYPQNGVFTEYLVESYARVLNYYRGSGTKLIFLRVPRAPVPLPDEPPKLNSAVRRLAREPNVVLLDEHLFDSLERPEFFHDAWHLNRVGLDRFSRILAVEIRKVLGPPKS